VALNAGADDVTLQGESFEVLCDTAAFDAVKQALESAQIPCDRSEIARISKNTVELDVEQARQVLNLISVLEEHEDVQSVTANYSIPDHLIAEIQASL